MSAEEPDAAPQNQRYDELLAGRKKPSPDDAGRLGQAHCPFELESQPLRGRRMASNHGAMSPVVPRTVIGKSLRWLLEDISQQSTPTGRDM